MCEALRVVGARERGSEREGGGCCIFSALKTYQADLPLVGYFFSFWRGRDYDGSGSQAWRVGHRQQGGLFLFDP